MKRFLALFFLCCLTQAYSQKVNRKYLGVDAGYHFVGAVGALHFAEKMVAGASLSYSGIPTGPEYLIDTFGSVFSKYERLRNSYVTLSVTTGLSFQTSPRTLLVLTAGPSLVYATQYSDITIATKPSDGTEYPVYEKETKFALGLVARSDFFFAIGSHAALNIGLVGQTSFARPIILSPVLGIRFGRLKTAAK